jgi:hypothetical protein
MMKAETFKTYALPFQLWFCVQSLRKSPSIGPPRLSKAPIDLVRTISFQRLQPIYCLLKFLHAIFYLANEIWVGLGSLRLPKVCSHRGARSQ